MKKKILQTISILLITIFCGLGSVNAGSATIGFDGNSNVDINSNITIKMYVSNITGVTEGVVGVSGTLSFDTNYLQLVSTTPITTPYAFQFETNNKFAGLDMTLSNGIKNKTTIITFNFKALKLGNTTITCVSCKTDGPDESLSTTVTPKTITINNATSQPNATLSSLSVTGYTISPTFSSSTTSYSLVVPETTSSININATATDSAASITGNGSKTLSLGSNTFSIKVTNGASTKTYTLNVTRGNTGNKLTDLQVTNYSLSPSFNSDTTSYNVVVPNSVNSITITGTKANSASTVTGLGTHQLTSTNNTINIVVSGNNTASKTYTLNIIRENNSDATLSRLYIEGYTLNPVFNKNTNLYSMNVSNKVTGLTVNATPTNSSSRVEITGNRNWSVGINNIIIKVTAIDGTTNMYIVAVTRASQDGTTSTLSSDNYLNYLSFDNGVSLNEQFNKTKSNYNITVPNSVSSLIINAIPSSSKAKVEITGNKNLEVGKVNVIEIMVTAENGGIRYYTINASRSTKDSETNLKSLKVNGYELNPTFDKDTLEYNIKVDSKTDNLDVTAICENSNSKVTITGQSNLVIGKNTILIKVVDDSGFTKIYQINAIKEANNQIKILDMTITQFILWMVLLLFFIITLILLIVKKNKKADTTPIIEFKPEFNFDSKNQSDDDVIENGSVDKKKNINEDEIPFDPYDDIVTKEEIIAAIDDKDVDMLKMLLEQEALNQKKEQMKQDDVEGKMENDKKNN